MTDIAELVKARMMRTALQGPPDDEKKQSRFCKGKLDYGRPCRVVMIGDEEYCLDHKKQMEREETASSPEPEVSMHAPPAHPAEEIPLQEPTGGLEEELSVTIRPRDPADVELLEEIRKVSEDLEGDLLAMLHLAAGRSFRKAKRP